MNTIIRLLYDIHRNTSCFFKKTHRTPRLHLAPQEATTSKGGNLLRRHTRLLSNPEPPSMTCFVHNINPRPNDNIRSIIYNPHCTISTLIICCLTRHLLLIFHVRLMIWLYMMHAFYLYLDKCTITINVLFIICVFDGYPCNSAFIQYYIGVSPF